jgi:hypothetical protein
MLSPWYSYKCRFEALYDFGQFIYCLEDENVKFVNNKIKQVDMEFEWEFESDYMLEDLKKLMMTINKEEAADLHVMYESLNYRAVYTGDRVPYEHLRQLMFQ